MRVLHRMIARFCVCPRHRVRRVIARHKAGAFDASECLDRIRRIVEPARPTEGQR
jgi:hypothetical protein